MVLGKGDKQVLKRSSRRQKDLLSNELKPFLQVLYALVLWWIAASPLQFAPSDGRTIAILSRQDLHLRDIPVRIFPQRKVAIHAMHSFYRQMLLFNCSFLPAILSVLEVKSEE
jgi:hypothetical protein